MLGFLRRKREGNVVSNRVSRPQNRKIRKVSIQKITQEKASIKEKVSGALESIKKFFRFVSKAFMSLSLVAVLFGGGYLIHSSIQKSSTFQIKNIHIGGHQRLNQKTVLSAGGIDENSHAFSISVSEVEEKLLSHPWIAEAHVERKLPDRLDIQIEEHEPVALLKLDRLYLVSKDGIVFKKLENDDPYDFPLFSGIDEELIVAQPELSKKRLFQALHLMDEYMTHPQLRKTEINEIHYEADGSILLSVGKQGTEVRLGQNNMGKKLDRLEKIYKKLQQKATTAQYVLLDNELHPHHVTVQLASEEHADESP